jgi:hypothetical protein
MISGTDHGKGTQHHDFKAIVYCCWRVAVDFIVISTTRIWLQQVYPKPKFAKSEGSSVRYTMADIFSIIFIHIYKKKKKCVKERNVDIGVGEYTITEAW